MLKIGIINERGEGVNEDEIRDIFTNIVRIRIDKLVAKRKFYNRKRLTVDEYVALAKEVYDETLGIAKRRAVARRIRVAK